MTAPAAREWTGGRSCAKLHHWHLLSTWYPSRGKPSAQQCTPCAGQGLTSHSPRAGQKWGTSPISPMDSEIEEGDRPQLHHPPGSLSVHPHGDRADMGTVPHLTVSLRLQSAASHPGGCSPPGWHESIAEHGTWLAVKEDPGAEGNFVRDSSKSDKSPWGKPQCSPWNGHQGTSCFHTLCAGEPHGYKFLAATLPRQGKPDFAKCPALVLPRVCHPPAGQPDCAVWRSPNTSQ